MQLIIASVWIVLGSVVLFKVNQQLSEVSSLHSGQNVSREYRYASPIPFNFQRYLKGRSNSTVIQRSANN